MCLLNKPIKAIIWSPTHPALVSGLGRDVLHSDTHREGLGWICDAVFVANVDIIDNHLWHMYRKW